MMMMMNRSSLLRRIQWVVRLAAFIRLAKLMTNTRSKVCKTIKKRKLALTMMTAKFNRIKRKRSAKRETRRRINSNRNSNKRARM